MIIVFGLGLLYIPIRLQKVLVASSLPDAHEHMLGMRWTEQGLESVHASRLCFHFVPGSWPPLTFPAGQRHSVTLTHSRFKAKPRSPNQPLTHSLSPLMSHHRPSPPTPPDSPESRLSVCWLQDFCYKMHRDLMKHVLTHSYDRHVTVRHVFIVATLACNIHKSFSMFAETFWSMEISIDYSLSDSL